MTSETTAHQDQDKNLVDFKTSVHNLMIDAIDNPQEGMRVFQNMGSSHARVVIDEMFNKADNCIFINCQRLSNDVFSYETLKILLERTDTAVEVIVDNLEEAQSEKSLLPQLTEFISNGKLKVYARSNDDNHYRHFVLVDNKDDNQNHLRLETDSENRKADVFFMCPQEEIKPALDAFKTMRENAELITDKQFSDVSR